MYETKNEIENLVHLYMDGAFNRRELVRRVKRHTGSLAAALLALQALGVEEAAAQQCPADLRVAENAADLETGMVDYRGPGGTVFGYLARPRDSGNPPRTRSAAIQSRLPAVLVIHENRGLNDHIKDVTRRLSRAGYVALGVDLISRLGGTHQFPDPVQAGQAYNRVGAAAYLEDMQASLTYLKNAFFVHPERLGAVGFCAGGANCFQLAVNTQDLAAAVVFYGNSPNPLDQLDRLRAQFLGLYAELDRGITSRVPDLVTGLLNRSKPFGIHIYQGARHAFNNDTGAAYNRAAATDAWARTIAFFDRHLKKLEG